MKEKKNKKPHMCGDTFASTTTFVAVHPHMYEEKMQFNIIH
jgi:hypothetical protein